MSKLLKKVFLSFLLCLTLLLSFAPFIATHAQDTAPPPEGTWYNQGFGEWYNKVYNEELSPGSEIFGERYTAAQVQWVAYSLFAFILNASLGSSNQEVVSCFLANVGDVKSCIEILKEMKLTNGSILPQSSVSNSSFLGLVFADRPFSGITYAKRIFNKFDLVQEANAQSVGIGFSALKPVQDMWKAFRDISFGFFIVIAIVMAFMIMFRVKISPQVVISIQSAIPKLVIALVLATFSYAIAGFLVDIMYVVIGFFSLAGSNLLGPIEIDPRALFNLLTLGQPVGLNVQFGILPLLVVYISSLVLAFALLLFYNFGIAGGVLGAAALIGFAATGGGAFLEVVAVLIVIILVLLLIWNLIKTGFTLIKTFANILLLTIFAPIQISLGAVIPNFGFGTWVRSYLSNLSVFVVVGVLIFFSFVFLIQGLFFGMDSMDPAAGLGWGETFVKFLFGSLVTDRALGNFPEGWPPLLGASAPGMTGLLFLGVSFIMFTIIPKSTEIVKSFIEGKPFDYGSSIGELGGYGQAYGLYSVGSLSKGDWPFPLNYIFRGRRVPKTVQDQAEILKRPIESVTSITRGTG